MPFWQIYLADTNIYFLTKIWICLRKKKKEIYIYSVLHVVMCVKRRTAGEPRVKRLFDDTTQTGFYDKGFSTSLSLFRHKIKSDRGRKIQTMKTKGTWNWFSCVQRESLSNVQKLTVPIKVLAEFVVSPRICTAKMSFFTPNSSQYTSA